MHRASARAPMPGRQGMLACPEHAASGRRRARTGQARSCRVVAERTGRGRRSPGCEEVSIAIAPPSPPPIPPPVGPGASHGQSRARPRLVGTHALRGRSGLRAVSPARPLSARSSGCSRAGRRMSPVAGDVGAKPTENPSPALRGGASGPGVSGCEAPIAAAWSRPGRSASGPRASRLRRISPAHPPAGSARASSSAIRP